MGWWRRHSVDWLSGSGHLLIVYITAELEDRAAWPYALAAMAAVSFCAWAANYRRYRHVHDLPTSKIATAAQGYVELFGRSQPRPDSPLTAPLTHRPCCWYRYLVQVKTSDGKWRTEDEGESVAHFLLVDDTDQCTVLPDGAEVVYAHTSTWTEGTRHYCEWLLEPGGVLYALGELRTLSGRDLDIDLKKEISRVLAGWKDDPAHFLQRFDIDGNGTVDVMEWEAARLQARREFEKNRSASASGEGLHVLRKPADGRVFILAAGLPEKIGRRYVLWSWGHLAFFFGAGIGSYFLLKGAPA